MISDDNVTEMGQLNITAKSLSPDEINTSIGENAAEVEVNVQNVHHSNLMTLTNMHAIGVMYDGQAHTIHSSYMNVDRVSVAAGFSSFDWKAMIGKGHDEVRVPIKLPNAQIASFDVSVSYKGHIVSTEASNVNVPAFSGSDQTDSDELIQHITRNILAKSPSFISNAEILGVSITDNIGTHAGRTLLGATLAGSVAGSVVGVVAVDAVKGAVSAGKSFRGATSDDGYKFGDFTRGIFHGVKEAPNAGFSGTAKSVGTYTSENKSRLAGAGGSGLGMVIGTAVAGPIGFFAGAYLGSVAGSKAVEDTPREDTGCQQSADLIDFGDSFNEGVYIQHPPMPSVPSSSGTDVVNVPASESFRSIEPGTSHLQHPTQRIATYPGSRHVPPQAQQDVAVIPAQRPAAETNSGYRFGDLTKSVVAKGKQNSGRSDQDGYKFGDFTRGLFGK